MQLREPGVAVSVAAFGRPATARRLARALAVEPSVLLLDEPFGALDAKVRLELRRWLRQLHDEMHITSVFVTHDQEEALEVADSVAVMNEGRIEQIGAPDDVYNHPATSFVFNFLGSVNLFHGRIDNGTTYIHRRRPTIWFSCARIRWKLPAGCRPTPTIFAPLPSTSTPPVRWSR